MGVDPLSPHDADVGPPEVVAAPIVAPEDWECNPVTKVPMITQYDKNSDDEEGCRFAIVRNESIVGYVLPPVAGLRKNWSVWVYAPCVDLPNFGPQRWSVRNVRDRMPAYIRRVWTIIGRHATVKDALVWVRDNW